MIKNKISFFVLFFVLFSILFCKYNHYTALNKSNPYPIEYDVFGYYLYLPSTFIYHDLALEKKEWQEKIREKYKPSDTYYQVADGINGKHIIVYDPGYVFINLPGFLIAHWIAPSLGFETDGFSKPYQISLILTALLISIMGLLLFRKLSLLFFSDKITSLLLLTIGLGTNYFFEITYNSTMPHNFLFTINGCIVWFTIKWHNENKLKYILYLAFLIGFASLCRATELIWILLPLFWNVYDRASFLEKFKLLKKIKNQFLAFCTLLIFVLFIRFFYLFYTSGSFFSINHHGEQLSLLDPYTFKFLFSFRKGWLLYTPMMVFAIIGFYYLRKEHKKIWLSCFLFFVINLYVVSSWECWWYASSFGQRPMVETYSMMFIPLGFFFKTMYSNTKWWICSGITVLVSFFIVLNLFQTWQLMSGILDSERMTKKYYLETFGKTSFDKERKKYLSVDRNQIVFSEYEKYSENYIKKDSVVLNFENEAYTIDSSILINKKEGFGKKGLMMVGPAHFSPSFEKKYKDITQKSYVWVKASVWIYLLSPFSESNSFLIVTTQTKERTTKYVTSGSALENTPIHIWTKLQLDFLSPDARHSNDKISVYYWNPGNKPVLIDNLQIEIFEPKVDYE